VNVRVGRNLSPFHLFTRKLLRRIYVAHTIVCLHCPYISYMGGCNDHFSGTAADGE